MARRRNTIILFVICLLLLSPSLSYSSDRLMALHEAVSTALQDNPNLKAFGRSVAAGREDIGISRSYLLPRIAFEERVMRTNNPTYAFMAKLNQERFTMDDFAISSLNDPDPVSDLQTSLFFEQPLFAPKVYLGMEMAKKEFLARSEELKRKREEVAFEVLRIAYDLKAAKAFGLAAEKGLEDVREHLRLAESRYHAGTGLYADVLRVKVALASAEEKKVSAVKNLRIAKRALGLILGLNEPVDITDAFSPPVLQDLSVYEAAVASRKDIRAMEARLQNAGNGVKMARAGFLPVIGIGGSYQLNHHSRPFGQEGESWQISAILRWELFEGLRTVHEKEKAAHKLSETEAYLEGLKKQISFLVYEAYLAVSEAQTGIGLAHSAVASAEEGRRLVQRRYENSLSGMVDLLDVQAHLDAARADAVAREGAYGKAMANLALQSGMLLKELGME